MRERFNRLPPLIKTIVAILLLALFAWLLALWLRPDQETLFQASTLSALQVGVYDGQTTIAELEQHGDFGLGTFNALDGEMIVLEGQVYQVKEDGRATLAAADERTPFAAVTFFEPDMRFTVAEPHDCSQLEEHLDGVLPTVNAPYAVRVSGPFSTLTVRAPRRQSQPYRPLAEALADQAVFEVENATGDMVGFRLPDYMSGVNAAGYHFHFISQDRQSGGHVLDCQTAGFTVEIDAIDQLQVVGVQNDALLQGNLTLTALPAAAAGPLTVFAVYAAPIAEPWEGVIHNALTRAQEAGDIVYTYADELGFEGDMERALRQAIDGSAPPDIIFADAFGNEEALRQLAQEQPQIAFVLGSDQAAADPNVSVFNSWLREPAYLAGMLAGGLTESNIIGVVAGFPEGSVNHVINAFIAGAEEVNPAVDARATFINSWYDLDAAGAATLAQIEAGADVIFAEREGVIEAAAGQGVYTIGNVFDQQALAPDSVISSLLWSMEATVQHVIGQVEAGTYAAEDLAQYSLMPRGGARLAPLNTAISGGIPADLLARVEARQAEIIGGQFVVPVDTSQPPPSTKAVVLGALYNLTGAQAELDVPSAQGAQLAIDEANQAGGVLGRPLQLVTEDGASSPAAVAKKTAAIASQYPQVAAFLGLSDTDMVLSAAPVAAAAGRLFLTSGATSPQLPAQVPDWLFLAAFGDNVQAAAAAEWAYNDQGARTAAVLFNESASYTQLLQGYFAGRFQELGGQILASQSYDPGDSESISQAIDQLAEADILFVAAEPEDAPEAAGMLRAAGFTAPILGGDGFDIGAQWQEYADLDNIFFTTHAYLGADNPDPRVQAFRAAYSAAYPDSEPDAFAALGYDAARLLIQALAAAGSADPAGVRQALAAMQQFEGVTGAISFTPGNPIPSKAVTILAVQQGDYHFISQIVPESVPAP